MGWLSSSGVELISSGIGLGFESRESGFELKLDLSKYIDVYSHSSWKRRSESRGEVCFVVRDSDNL